MQAKILKIVVASPGDVIAERDAVDACVVRLNSTLLNVNIPYQFVVRRWERDAIPGLHPSGPQGRIDEALKIPECDFLVGIFWKKLGTPVGTSASGSEHEIRQAIASWEEKQSPQVLLYFNGTPTTPATPEEAEQLKKLEDFWQNLSSSKNPPLMHKYPTREEFSLKVFQDLLASAIALDQRANSNHPSSLQFEVTSKPLHVRSEGYTELVGDIFIRFTYIGEVPVFGPTVLAFVVYMNSLITSRGLSHSNTPFTSEAVLYEVGRPDSANVTHGFVKGTRIWFEMVEVRDLLPGETRTFRISNIRCNAVILDGHPIMAAVKVVGRLEDYRITLGTPTRALTFAVTADELKRSELCTNGSTTLLAYTPALLTFTEGFPSAFKTNYPSSSTLFNEDKHGSIALSESSGDSPRVKVPGSSRATGEADCGTRLMAHLRTPLLGPRVRLFVSLRNLSSSSARFDIVDNREGIVDKGNTVTINGVEMCELLISEDVASAVWELVERCSVGPLTVEFMAALAFEEDFGERLIQLGWSIDGHLAPTTDLGYPSVGSPGTASSVLPIPRFISHSAPSVLVKVFVPFSDARGS
jgi:hypothetical protein